MNIHLPPETEWFNLLQVIIWKTVKTSHWGHLTLKFKSTKMLAPLTSPWYDFFGMEGCFFFLIPHNSPSPARNWFLVRGKFLWKGTLVLIISEGSWISWLLNQRSKFSNQQLLGGICPRNLSGIWEILMLIFLRCSEKNPSQVPLRLI